MKLPEGYEELTGKQCPPNSVCKLRKSKQASSQWNHKLSSVILGDGLTRTHSDHSLFIKYLDQVFLDVLVYVDDILIISNNDSATNALKDVLKFTFKLRGLGQEIGFLGFEIARNSDWIYLNQQKYVVELLEEAGLLVQNIINSYGTKSQTLYHIRYCVTRCFCVKTSCGSVLILDTHLS